MQVAKGPYKCVLRQLRMTCELRSCPRTPQLAKISCKRYPHGTSPACRRDTSGGKATGQPQDASKAAAGGIPQGALTLTTDLQLTSAHWLVALAKSSSQRAAPARPEVLATATQATSGHALGA